MKTLEDYLQYIYNKISTDRSKESYIDGYEAWIESLDADEVMEYAEEFIAIIREEHEQKENLPYSVEIENRKLEEETQGMSIKSRHLVDENKPFLDGMNPSEWINKQTSMSDKDMTIRNWGRPATVLDSTLTMMSKIMEAFDLLVEELKKNGAIK